MPKDENKEDQTVEETETEETEDNNTEDEDTVESLREKLAANQKALDKANRERTRLGKKVKDQPKDTPEVPELTDRAKRALAVSELRSRGLTDAQAKKFAKLVALDDIEIDDDGDVVGIDLEDIEDEFPELFNKSGETNQKKNGGRKPDTGDKSSKSDIPSGLSEASKKMLRFAQNR